MEFPIEIQQIINEYAKPMTKPDWRKGAHINSICRNHIKCIGSQYMINIQLNQMYNSMGHIYNEKLIPNGMLVFNENHFISAYDAIYADEIEWW